MMVDDIRGELHVLAEDEDSFGEKDEALCIVEIIAFGCAVEIFPIKELLSAEEINWDILVEMAQVDIRLEFLISDGDLDLFAHILKGKAGLFHHSVIRHD
jgi:hypothetical protein